MSLSNRTPRLRPRWARAVTGAALCVALVAGCNSGDTLEGRAADGSSAAAVEAGSLFDSSIVHDIALDYDTAAYEAMIAEFRATGDKGWIEADLTVDGETYERVGIRLKGNSSLMGLRTTGTAGNVGGRVGPGGSASADTPNALPWLVRLDKYVDGQDHDGTTEFVIRSNNTQTSLNEAVALELLGLTGQVTQKAFATRFRINGGDVKLRLAIENPADEWAADNFDGEGIVYKAESGGDYRYRGDDPSAYDEVFDQETGTDDENLEPLIDFLQFINEADDATFAAELGEHLDITAFARYLAGQELVANTDDIDGPGNNSYLRFDEETGVVTVLSWDLNLAFGGLGGGGAGGAAPGNAGALTPGGGGRGLPTAPANGAAPTGAAGGPRTPGAGGFGGRTNVLVTRFLANAGFAAQYQQALAAMRADLYGGGRAAEVVARWTTLLTTQASDLVPAATIEQEAANISRYFTAS